MRRVKRLVNRKNVYWRIKRFYGGSLMFDCITPKKGECLQMLDIFKYRSP